MAGKSDKNREQDLGSYLRSQGASTPRGRSDLIETRVTGETAGGKPARSSTSPRDYEPHMQRRRWILLIVVGQAMLLLGVFLYLRGPVERMRHSVSGYSGDGEAAMVSGSFISYGYVVEMPPFSLSEPFRATYTLGELPWTDKAFALSIETAQPLEGEEMFKEGELEIRVFDGGTTLLAVSGRLEGWIFGKRGQTDAIYHPDGFNLQPTAVLNREALTIEMNYTPSGKYQSSGSGALKVYTGGFAPVSR